MTVYITGDTHGEYSMKRLSNKHFPESKILTKDDVVIVAGDFGLIFHNEQTKAEKWWLDWLKTRPFTTCFVDGNHENHRKLAELKQVEKWGGTVGKVSEKVYHLRRGEIYDFDGLKILTVGGAASIDRLDRRLDISWWKEEEINYADIDRTLINLEKHNNTVDYIITHTCPATIGQMYCGAKGFHYFKGKLQDSNAQFFDHLLTKVTFKHWFFGHWHDEWDFGKYHMLYNRIVNIWDYLD